MGNLQVPWIFPSLVLKLQLLPLPALISQARPGDPAFLQIPALFWPVFETLATQLPPSECAKESEEHFLSTGDTENTPFSFFFSLGVPNLCPRSSPHFSQD